MFLRRMLVLPIVALSLSAAALHAGEWTVTRYDDPVPNGCEPSDCSLREAVIAASAANSSDTIYLSAGTYELTQIGAGPEGGDLDVKGTVEIVGAGATMTTLDGNQLDRVLQFTSFANSDAPAVLDLAVTGGLVAAVSGAAISGSDLHLTVERCEVYGNSNGLDSFGVVAVSIGSTLTMNQTTIHDNTGGGVSIGQSTGQIFNSTFANNSGSELQANSSTVYCNHCTLWDDGGSLSDVLAGSDSTIQLANTAVLAICSTLDTSSIESFGGNLESPGDTCSLDLASDHPGVDVPGFSALAMNGGPTPTMLQNAASPAVSGANDTFCHSVDQRGATRPDVDCDIGAVERVSVRPPIPLFADGFLQGDEEAWSDAVGD